MRQLLSILCALFISAMPLFAQSAKSEKPQFIPHWYMQIQGGVGHTLGEANFGKLISPAAAISAGRQFSPIWGLRVGVSGWEGRGAWFTPSQVYKFNFMQLNADVTVDLANWLGGFKPNRVVNPYILVGVGGNFAFNNDQAKDVNDSGKKLSLLWTDSKVFAAGRAGAGVNFRLSDRVQIGLEVNTNMLSDKFNSKKAGNLDWQMNALAGLTFRFGKSHKQTTSAPVVMPPQRVEPPQVEEPVVVAVVEPEVIPVIEPIVEEPVAMEPTPAPVVESTPAPRSYAQAPPSPDTYKVRQDVLFAINSSDLRPSESSKIEALAKSLNENPKSRVSVVGYADAPTGNSQGNYWLSGWRAIRVRDALKAKGISNARIDMNFVGDREQPYSDVKDNRVVICIVR